jgi:hypothetical protein
LNEFWSNNDGFLYFFSLNSAWKETMSGIIPEKWGAREVEIVAGSGMLCVTIHPRRDWSVGLAALAWDAMLIAVVYQFWSRMPLSFRVILIAILIAGSLTLVYEFSGEEILEFDSKNLTIRKGVHGWEQKREYPIEQCSKLGWSQGRKVGPYLALSVGTRSIKFGKRLSEDAANEVLTALQRALPDVAQKVCSSTESKEHFVTLGLNKQ